jgi:hypothetical protein
MNHEPIAERVRRHLIGLSMPRALEALQTVQSQLEQGQLTALEAIEVLLGEEYITRMIALPSWDVLTVSTSARTRPRHI